MTTSTAALIAEPRPVDRARAATMVRARFDRVLWQRLEVRDGVVTAVVAGTRHRRPRQLRVGHVAALALRDAGVPTIGRRGSTP